MFFSIDTAERIEILGKRNDMLKIDGDNPHHL
jgi:hypothetical protein